MRSNTTTSVAFAALALASVASAASGPLIYLNMYDHTLPVPGALFRSDLLQIMASRLKHPKDDPFTGEFTASYAGKPFSFFQPIEPQNEHDYPFSSIRWSYDIPSEILKMRLNPQDGIEFWYNERESKSTGTTRRGVKKRIAVDERTEGEIQPTNMSDLYSVELDIKAAPEEARILSAHLFARIEGKLETVSGHLAECDLPPGSTPTISDPTTENYLSCRLNGSITRITFYDTRTTTPRVLGQWPP